MLGQLSIIGAVLMIPTALFAQMGGSVNPGVHIGGAVNPGATVRGAVERGIPGQDWGVSPDGLRYFGGTFVPFKDEHVGYPACKLTAACLPRSVTMS